MKINTLRNMQNPYLKKNEIPRVSPEILKQLRQRGLDKIISGFDDPRLKNPYNDLNAGGHNVEENWTLMDSYNGSMVFQYGKGEYFQTYILAYGFAEIFSKAGNLKQTLRKSLIA